MRLLNSLLKNSYTIKLIFSLLAVLSLVQTGDAFSDTVNQKRKLKIADLPLATEINTGFVGKDWLVKKINQPTQAFRSADGNKLIISNGLIRREFQIKPNLCTVGWKNLMTGQAVLRGIKPEIILNLDKKDYTVGGLKGQWIYAYLKDSNIGTLRKDPDSFQITNIEIGRIKKRMQWKRIRHHDKNMAWPPKGLEVRFDYTLTKKKYKGLKVSVYYAFYDSIPLTSKWFTIKNRTGKNITLNSFKSNIMAVMLPQQVYAETDYAFGGEASVTAANKCIHWKYDPQLFTERIRVKRLLEISPPIGPDLTIQDGDDFESYRDFVLIMDSEDRVRQNLSVCKMYRYAAPWTTENPIMMHIRSSKTEDVKLAIDQCAAVGFEMVIISFGSGFNMENNSPSHLGKWKEVADYARNKGVEIGSYSLLASRSISPEVDVISPKTGKPGGAMFGHMPCLGSAWGISYLKKIKHLLKYTGFSLLEHDGSYPGDKCASTTHPGHRGLEDSQWAQWTRIREFYQWCRSQGIYLNVPDWYYLSGTNKVMMPYREENWGLPREEQKILARQNIYEGTLRRTPSMGWMLLPLVPYKGGKADAILEPLCDHLEDYSFHLAMNFACGVQSCYRGTRLYDTDKTKTVVKKWVDFYKKYRRILDSDIVHLGWPDGRNIDGVLHVNPGLKEKGFAVLFNPKDKTVTTQVKLPLYYTGLTDRAKIREGEGKSLSYKLARDYSVSLEVTFGPGQMKWFVIE